MGGQYRIEIREVKARMELDRYRVLMDEFDYQFDLISYAIEIHNKEAGIFSILSGFNFFLGNILVRLNTKCKNSDKNTL